MQDYRQLRVWSQSHALVLSVYSATVAFPKTELYGLSSQLRRAAVSVPSNIAEGASRSSGNDFARFLEITTSHDFLKSPGGRSAKWSTSFS
jgi:four helix bundle protein